MTEPSAHLALLEFSDGTRVSLEPFSKVVVVGPNNGGKSRSLRDITSFAGNKNYSKSLVVRRAEFEVKGSSDDLLKFLEENAEYHESSDSFIFVGCSIKKGLIKSWGLGGCFSNFYQAFLKKVGSQNRLQITETKETISPNKAPYVVQHILYNSDAKMLRVSHLFRQAFGLDLFIDFRGGREIPIHIGTAPDREVMPNQVSNEYVAAVRANPLLHEQGDGMRSYAGLLFETVVGLHQIVLVDEPEAFLHPPQMRRLGHTFATEVSAQLIIATHSSDILRGVLEGASGGVTIVRLRREGDMNPAFLADPETVKQLWVRPELRYSNALEALFHEQAIICEDDGDCRLLNAMADFLAEDGQNDALIAAREGVGEKVWPDTAYVPAGGKHGVRSIAELLRKVGVPTKAVFDIDVLNDQVTFRATVEAFGGDWLGVEPIWHKLDQFVRDGVAAKSIPEIKEEVSEILDQSDDISLPKGKVLEAMKQTSEWNIIKRLGIDGLPCAEAKVEFDKLSLVLEGIGIYLIDVGEMENFSASASKHGRKFVNELLENVPLGSEELDSLRAFTKRVHLGPSCPL